MPSPLVKSWKYLMAAFGAKIDEKADPKIQIMQATAAAQAQHAALTAQAASIIGFQRKIEMELARQAGDVGKLQDSALQAILKSDEARATDCLALATRYETAAQEFATRLVTAETSLENLKATHASAIEATDRTKQAVEASSRRLQHQLEERSQLLSQLEQAKMQEQASASLQAMTGLSGPRNVPALNEVRDKIEGRYARALGSAELSRISPHGQALELERATLDTAGSGRLAQIRADLAGDRDLSGSAVVDGEIDSVLPRLALVKDATGTGQ